MRGIYSITNFGKTPTIETLNKMSLSQKGNKNSVGNKSKTRMGKKSK